MKALATAIFSKMTSATDLYALIGGRLFHQEAPEGAEFPYVVFLIVSDMPEYPGGKTIEDVLLQFSILSTASSFSEAGDILVALRALYDDCTLTISGSTLIYFIRRNYTSNREEVTTPAGTVGAWHATQEYELQAVA